MNRGNRPFGVMNPKGTPRRRPSEPVRETYEDFSATELYCPKCRAAVPVRERLLLVLPDGDLYEYRCVRCGTPVGEKTSRSRDNDRIVLT